MENKNIAIIALAFLLVIILVQNTQVVSVQFLFWNISMSRIILILFVFLIGFGSGYLVKKR